MLFLLTVPHALNIAGHPEYGCIISKEKTLTNFEHESIEAAYITKPTQKCMIHSFLLFRCLMANRFSLVWFVD
jgi:hypothetical protein